MGVILAICGKDLRVILRNRGALFFTFFFPLVAAILFGVVFSGGGGSTAIPVVVVDQDGTAGSRAFVATLEKAAELQVTTADLAKARTLVRRGKEAAYIRLQKGFGAAQQRIFWGKPARIQVGLDPSRRAAAGMLKGVLTRYAFEGMQKLFSDPDAGRRYVNRSLAELRRSGAAAVPAGRQNLTRFLGDLDQFLGTLPATNGAAGPGSATGTPGRRGALPVEIDEVKVARIEAGPQSAFAVSFPQGILWGLLGCAATFALTLVAERSRGTLLRLRTAPIGRVQLLAGKAAACFAALLVVQVALLAVGALVFGLRFASPMLLPLVVLSSAICFVGVMMLLSVLGRGEQSASGITWAVVLVMAMLGGGMLPLFLMPPWMQALSNASPAKWATLAYEGAVWRGFGLVEMLKPCGVLVAVGVVCFAAGARAFRD